IPTWKYAQHFRGPFMQSEERGVFEYKQLDRGFHHQNIPYVRNLAISGLFQSEKYFIKYADDIRSMFSMSPHSSVREEVEQNAEHITYSGVTCAIHVRRGDYLNHPQYHPTLSPGWYQQAMKHFHPD